MRRIIAILVVLAGVTGLLVSGTAAGGEEDAYEVRAIFDNASFLVPGEEVRVAGTKVGTVADVEVTRAGEAARADGDAEPGKAAVVLRIDDPAFQDFREDASCLIRPQSLIGEKFVECRPTRPRASATPQPPALEVLGEGESGEGQHLLPLEQNGKSVDLDLVNNIMDEPYPDRFRLILNELGAGLAARGEELAEIIERSNPALRETNEVLAILARQNRSLAQLSTDSDAILGALARERESVAGFINESTVTAEATAERRADLEQTFARFPGFLRELRATMVELRAFGDQATPVFADLRDAAPALTEVNRRLEPFSRAGTGALVSLGEASEGAGPPLVASDPVLRQLRAFARAAEAPIRDLADLLSTLRRTDGFQYVLETIFGLGGTVNAFDSYGHFLRALIPTNSCFDYTTILQAGCGANFTGEAAFVSAPASQARAQYERLLRELAPGSAWPDGPVPPQVSRQGPNPAGTGSPSTGSLNLEAGELEDVPAPAEPPAEPEVGEPDPEVGELSPEAAPSSPPRLRATRDLLEFLLGSARSGGRGR